MDNIQYGKLDTSEVEVIKAAALVNGQVVLINCKTELSRCDRLPTEM
ncbi:hypothetical protein [Petralouisia muris]|nr:hypothetical protein [Petralouisia muris]